MDYYDNSSCCFDDLINDIEDSSYQSDVLVNTGDFSDFFDALISSRNVLYSSEDMYLQHGFCQMDSYQREFHFEQQNVLELGNSSDGFSSPSPSSDLLASSSTKSEISVNFPAKILSLLGPAARLKRRFRLFHQLPTPM